jgi:hypothetical protein
MGVSGQRNAPAVLTPGKGLPVGQEAGWASELDWTEARGKIILPLPGIKPRSPGRPVRSQETILTEVPQGDKKWFKQKSRISV